MQQRHKQRIIGAVVIIALTVIFLPMLLQGPVEHRGLDVPMEIPPRPEAPLSRQSASRQVAEPMPALDRVPLRAARSDASAGDSPSAPAREAPAAVPEPQELPVPQPDAAVAEPEPKPEPTPPQEPSAPVNSELAAFAVQVGSFRSQDNAVSLRNRLREQGFSAFVEEFSVNGSAIYRLRVGPVIERSEAETLMRRLKQDAQLEGLVMSHP